MVPIQLWAIAAVAPVSPAIVDLHPIAHTCLYTAHSKAHSDILEEGFRLTGHAPRRTGARGNIRIGEANQSANKSTVPTMD